ncbi:MAG TPA: hypothetical protein DCR14_17545, partial [Acidimicrobiaceae bacterium]|nr:hypothetical protein [Acidimicrobiaceae bacterium]
MIAASGGGVDLSRLLLDLLIIIFAAKLLAELAERARIPAVLGEIVAGILVGPSVLNLIHLDEARGVSLSIIAEIGVLLLLLQVGMEMDLRELRKVGKASLLVAIIGVAAPFAGGLGVGLAFGLETNTAIFIGAALTATSVGITARVFGDLRALATTEARVVLGAAVADDVLGLVILTVVVKIVTGGDVGVGTVASTLGLALLFLLATGVVGLLFVPKVLDAIHRRSHSPATITVAAVVLMLGFAELANAAKLAFIIGAFMAGLSLGASKHHDRVARDLGSVGNVFIPVFFAQIGINADLEAMTKPSVLGIAAVLSVVAIAGKLLAAAGMVGTKGDRLLVGIGMVPRGEVGLIFAAIGLTNAVLGPDEYGALLIVVLLTTIMTPPLLRWRLGRTALASDGSADLAADEPVQGWITVEKGEVRLHGNPPPSLTLDLALRTAILSKNARPSSALVDWFGTHRNQPIEWAESATPLLAKVLRDDNPRAWRFLDITGVLERALPEVAAAMDRRRADISDLDPMSTARFAMVERLDDLAAEFGLASDNVLLAALVADVCADSPEGDLAVQRLAARLMPTEGANTITSLVADAQLLRAGIYEADSFDEREILHLANHLGTAGHARDSYELAVAMGPLRTWQREALDQRVALIVEALEQPELTGSEATTLADARRQAALALVTDLPQRTRLEQASNAYLLSHSADDLARHAQLVEPTPGAREVRVAVTPLPDPEQWMVDVACRDTDGVLAHLANVLTANGYDISRATIATWPDGVVLDTFTVGGPHRPVAKELAAAFEAHLAAALTPTPMPDLAVSFDNDTLPEHTSVTVAGADHPGVLLAIAAAFAAADLTVHSARISTTNHQVNNRFAVSTRDGRKLDAAAM